MWQTSRVCLVLLFLDLCNVQRLVNVYWLWQSIGFVLGFCNDGVAVLRTQYPFVSPSRTSFVVGTFSEEYHLAFVISHISSNESANFCTLIPLFLLQMLVDVYGMVSCIPFYSWFFMINGDWSLDLVSAEIHIHIWPIIIGDY